MMKKLTTLACTCALIAMGGAYAQAPEQKGDLRKDKRERRQDVKDNQ